ncbi:MAG TPA: hypothetical protein VF945_18265, partial [Polyangia bacterium]
MRALAIVGKVLGWIVLTALLLVVSTLLTVVLVGRTEWGHRKLLAVALPALQEQLAGRLTIGAVDGDLTRGLVLRDVELDDAEHQPAVRVATLTVRYDLLGLARHTIDLTELDAEGVWVHARTLRSGELNLATLTRPSSGNEQQPSGWAFRVGKVRAEIAARYDAPASDDEPARTVRGTARLEGRASIAGGKVDAGIDALDVETLLPLRARLHARGGVTVDHGAVAARALALALTASGRELRKLAPGVALRGAWTIAVTADGPADRLALSLVAKPPAGRLAIDARLRT